MGYVIRSWIILNCYWIAMELRTAPLPFPPSQFSGGLVPASRRQAQCWGHQRPTLFEPGNIQKTSTATTTTTSTTTTTTQQTCLNNDLFENSSKCVLLYLRWSDLLYWVGFGTTLWCRTQLDLWWCVLFWFVVGVCVLGKCELNISLSPIAYCLRLPIAHR